mmetsp:Transcript_56279/g.167400  ORF Transcript_56279/g.167400 Transcript_56279/m.167400 type:complete len:229 (-) Transcript_56279:701-1387(-)
MAEQGLPRGRHAARGQQREAYRLGQELPRRRLRSEDALHPGVREARRVFGHHALHEAPRGGGSDGSWHFHSGAAGAGHAGRLRGHLGRRDPVLPVHCAARPIPRAAVLLWGPEQGEPGGGDYHFCSRVAEVRQEELQGLAGAASVREVRGLHPHELAGLLFRAAQAARDDLRAGEDGQAGPRDGEHPLVAIRAQSAWHGRGHDRLLQDLRGGYCAPHLASEGPVQGLP